MAPLDTAQNDVKSSYFTHKLKTNQYAVNTQHTESVVVVRQQCAATLGFEEEAASCSLHRLLHGCFALSHPAVVAVTTLRSASAERPGPFTAADSWLQQQQRGL